MTASLRLRPPRPVISLLVLMAWLLLPFVHVLAMQQPVAARQIVLCSAAAPGGASQIVLPDPDKPASPQPSCPVCAQLAATAPMPAAGLILVSLASTPVQTLPALPEPPPLSACGLPPPSHAPPARG